MAESIVQVNSGTGPKLHTFNKTIGANSVEDEVVILGEQYLASYTVTTGAVSTATSASHVLQIMAGASLKVRIRRIELFQLAAATAAAIGQFQILRLGTAGTGGTAITPMQLESTDAAAGATAMTLPTVKGTETGANVLHQANAYLFQTVGASTQFTNPLYVWDFDRLRMKPLIIPAGVANGICVKMGAAFAGATVMLVAYFEETSF